MKTVYPVFKNAITKKTHTFFINIFLLSGLFFLSAWSFWKSPPPEPRSATFSPDGQYLVFSIVYNKNHSDLYRIRKDGGALIRLTVSPGSDFDPAYSPDGSRIVFSRTQSGKYTDPTNLFIMDSDGAGIKQLTLDKACDISPVFSPDGIRIYFVRAKWFGRHSPLVASFWQDKDIYSIKLDGTDLKAVTNKSFYKLSKPSISHDGKEIAASLTMDKIMNALWTIPVENAKAMQLIKPKMLKYRDKKESENTDESALYQYLYDPLFLQDGKGLVFKWSAETMKHGYFEYEIYRMDWGTNEVHRLTNLNRSATPTDVSRDGKEIVFLFDPAWPKGGDPFELWIMNSDGANPRRIDVDLNKCLNCR